MNNSIMLSHQQIIQKLKRIAIEIIEQNDSYTHIYIGGVKPGGEFLGKIIFKELQTIISNTSYFSIDINTTNQIEFLDNSCLVIVDDVLNSGKTLMNIIQPYLSTKLCKLETAVLVNRNHRLYPIKANYVGLTMATTLKEHIYFDKSNPEDLKLILN